ncbi:hypothetical protein V5T82_07235 [Magnetovibrio sp. PR-2]|uniref:hypothetical protein n=1 Tax=Magnetovibrio sp. PR-2 TaxID=3120356 RepID=UPI002FCE5715
MNNSFTFTAAGETSDPIGVRSTSIPMTIHGAGPTWTAGSTTVRIEASTDLTDWVPLMDADDLFQESYSGTLSGSHIRARVLTLNPGDQITITFSR